MILISGQESLSLKHKDAGNQPAVARRNDVMRLPLKKRARFGTVGGVVAVLFLAGCSEGERYEDPSASYVTPSVTQAVDHIIAEQQGSAVEAIQTVARIERTRTPPTVTDPNDGAPPELQQKVTELNWSGTAEGLVKELAEKIGYSYIASAAPIDNLMMVTVDIRDRTVAEALDAVDLQIHNRAHIIVDAQAHTMTLQPARASDAAPSAAGPSGKPGSHPGGHHKRPVYHPKRTS